MKNLITEYMDIWTSAQIQKSNVGRGRRNNTNGQTIYGIKKLRELILELAVRGKLIPQDPNDEPANVLLKKIAKEKEKLIKEGKTRKQKLLPKINAGEKEFVLPDGWEWVRLGDIGRDWGQKTPTGDFSYIEVSGINNIAGTVESAYLLTASKAPSRARKIVKVGTVIYSTVRPYLKNICVIEKEYFPEPIASTAFAILHPLQRMPGKFVALFLRSPIFVRYVESVQTGIAYPAINDKQFFEGIIPIPPLAEQHRIVAKVDELMEICDQLEKQQTENTETHQTLVKTLLSTLTNAVNHKEFSETWAQIANHFDILFTTEESIDQLKQAILQLAVMGKLVEQNPGDLPAPVPEGQKLDKYYVYALECEGGSIYIGQTQDILKRWGEHAAGKGADWTKAHPPVKLVHWEEFNSREEAVNREKELKTGFGRKWIKRELAAGRTRQAGEPASVLLDKITKEKERLIKEGKIKKQKPLPEISEDEKLFELPEGWMRARIGDLTLVGTGATPDRGNSAYYFPDKLWWVTSGETSEDFITKTKEKISPLAVAKTNITIYPVGTLIVAMYGQGKTRGQVTELRIEAGTNQACAAIKAINTEVFHRRYIKLFFKKAYKEIRSQASGGAQPNLNVKKIRQAVITLPPLNEQRRIVIKVNKLIGFCESLKNRITKCKSTQMQLADIIVGQACHSRKEQVSGLESC